MYVGLLTRRFENGRSMKRRETTGLSQVRSRTFYFNRYDSTERAAIGIPADEA